MSTAPRARTEDDPSHEVERVIVASVLRIALLRARGAAASQQDYLALVARTRSDLDAVLAHEPGAALHLSADTFAVTVRRSDDGGVVILVREGSAASSTPAFEELGSGFVEVAPATDGTRITVLSRDNPAREGERERIATVVAALTLGGS